MDRKKNAAGPTGMHYGIGASVFNGALNTGFAFQYTGFAVGGEGYFVLAVGKVVDGYRQSHVSAAYLRADSV